MVSSVPDNLNSDAGAGESGDLRFLPRPITMEEAVGRQIDRISYLRSIGHPWSEAVFMLRDMIVGLEDDEFWDGIPAHARGKWTKAEGGEKATIAKQWAPEGWTGVPFRAYRLPDGGVVFRPTSENLSSALRIIMRLLARRGIAWRTRRRSDLGPRFNQGVVAAETGANGSSGGA